MKSIIKMTKAFWSRVSGLTLRILVGTAAVLLTVTGSPTVATAQLSFAAPTHLAMLAGASDLVVGDFNSDGNVDIAAVYNTGWPVVDSRFAVFLGDGTGSFSGPTISGKISGCWAGAAATADFNSDLNLDLAFTFGGSASGCFGAYGSSHLGDGTGGFSLVQTFFAGGSVSDVEAGDFNNDGKIDLVTNYVDANKIMVQRGLGNGTFSFLAYIPVAGRGPCDVEVNDFNGDGNLDLATASCHGYLVQVFLGNGLGGFINSDNISGTFPTLITSGDFDADGNIDLAVTDSGVVNTLFGDGTGRFTTPISFAAGPNPGGPAVGDFNSDGNLDLAVSNGAAQTVSILLGDGLGNFDSPIGFSAGANTGRRVRVADFNADGKLDLAVNSVPGVSVLLNTTAEINEPPVADAGPDQTVILGEIVIFDGSGSYDPDGTIDFYDWDFGDGDTDSGETTIHVYASPWIYTVTLTVTDDDGAIDTDTAIVTVQTPVEATQDLISDIEDLNLPKGTENSLVSKLEAAINSLDKGQENAAINKLNAFINQVEAQRGKKITDEEADALIAEAQRIIDNI